MKKTNNFFLKSKYKKLNNSQRLYNLDIPVIGLTGGIATGKTSVSDLLLTKGLFVICADNIIKEIYKKQNSIYFIKENIPKVVKNNEICMAALRRVFFENKKIQTKIENFLYPQMKTIFMEKLDKSKDIPLIIYDVPLLFEKELNFKIDVSICVYCPQEMQKDRIFKRDQIKSELIDNIISTQIDIEKKAKISDFVIDNSYDFEHLEIETIKTFGKILSPEFS